MVYTKVFQRFKGYVHDRNAKFGECVLEISQKNTVTILHFLGRYALFDCFYLICLSVKGRAFC